MIKIGDLCSLFFNPVKDSYSNGSYTQLFYYTDNILIQVLADAGEVPSGTINNLCTKVSTTIQWQTVSVNDTVTLYQANLKGRPTARYTVSLLGAISEQFYVTDSALDIEGTSLIRVSNKDNNSPFDNIFWIGTSQQFIDLRLECGFRPNGIEERVDNEQFRSQMQTVVQLYAVPYEVLTLSIGDSSGVPYWFAKAINRMLCVSYFAINGSLYVRSENSTPERQIRLDDSQLFWFTILLEQATNDIAGIGGKQEFPSGLVLPAFDISNAKDGEILRYATGENAWINTNRVD